MRLLTRFTGPIILTEPSAFLPHELLKGEYSAYCVAVARLSRPRTLSQSAEISLVSLELPAGRSVARSARILPMIRPRPILRSMLGGVHQSARTASTSDLPCRGTCKKDEFVKPDESDELAKSALDFAPKILHSSLGRAVAGQPMRNAAFQELRDAVLNSVASEHSKRNYAKALVKGYALCEERKQPLSRALLMEYRAAMLEKRLSASTVDVRLSAVRRLIGEAQRNRVIGAEEAANLAGVPNFSRKGTRLGNWLTRHRAKMLVTVPERSRIKGKRDYVILAPLLRCALPRLGTGQLGHRFPAC
jgi:hypothetical protein